MRSGIAIGLSGGGRQRLQTIVADRNSPQKHVWRTRCAAGCIAEMLRPTREKPPHDAPNKRKRGHKKRGEWLARHPSRIFHFTPTSCSWPSAVEGFFAKLTRRRLGYGLFRCVVDRQAAIERFIGEHNGEPDGDPKPFIWKAEP